MTMKALLICCLLAVASTAFAQDNVRPLQPQRMVLKITDTGAVSELRYESQAPASIVALVDRSVRNWRFSPKLVNGNPVPWATRLVVWLVAEKTQNAFRLKVDRVETQNLVVSRSGYPELPTFAARTFKKALACADLSMEEDDKPPAIAALWVDDKLVGKDNPYMRSMRVSLPRWKLEPLQVDGQSYGGGVVRVFVDYSATGGDAASALFALKCQAKPMTVVGSFRLLTPVVGRYLGDP